MWFRNELSSLAEVSLYKKHVDTLCEQNVGFLGAFAKLWRAIISIVTSVSVCLSAWNNWAPTGWISWNLMFKDISKIQFWLFEYSSLISIKQEWILYTITLRIFVVPTLSMVGDPLSGNGCGSPNHILFSFHLCFIYSFYSWHKTTERYIQ